MNSNYEHGFDFWKKVDSESKSNIKRTNDDSEKKFLTLPLGLIFRLLIVFVVMVILRILIGYLISEWPEWLTWRMIVQLIKYPELMGCFTTHFGC